MCAVVREGELVDPGAAESDQWEPEEGGGEPVVPLCLERGLRVARAVVVEGR